MKKTILTLIVLSLFTVAPAFAAVKDHGNTGSAKIKEHIHACTQQSESITNKIKRIQSEIDKGDTTYSAKGLKELEEKLQEINDMLNSDVLKN